MHGQLTLTVFLETLAAALQEAADLSAEETDSALLRLSFAVQTLALVVLLH